MSMNVCVPLQLLLLCLKCTIQCTSIEGPEAKKAKFSDIHEGIQGPISIHNNCFTWYILCHTHSTIPAYQTAKGKTTGQGDTHMQLSGGTQITCK